MLNYIYLILILDGAGDNDQEEVNKGAEIFGFKTPRRKSMLRTPLKTPTSVGKHRLNKTPNKTPLKNQEKASSIQTPQTVRRKLRNSKCNRFY